MDRFFTQQHCDRCGGSLKNGRIMSMFNTDCICIKCKREERAREDYSFASESEQEEVKKGNHNFKGVGYERNQ